MLGLHGCKSVPKTAENTANTSAVYTPPSPKTGQWQPVPLQSLPRWGEDTLGDIVPAMLQNCAYLAKQKAYAATWKTPCEALKTVPQQNETAIRTWVQQYLNAYEHSAKAGIPSAAGIATGYFEPVYEGRLNDGSMNAQEVRRFRFPLHAPPILKADKVPSRADIAANPALAGAPVAWLENPIDAFLVHVQGSTRIRLADGSTRQVGFAGKNGLQYASIANTLIAQGVFKSSEASMDNIRRWAAVRSDADVQAVLNTNPSYIYFRLLADKADSKNTGAAQLGPIGAAGLPLTTQRSVAVDATEIPLGAPLWVNITPAKNANPAHTTAAFNRMMIAQDTGSAIVGANRIDYFWGTGAGAGNAASAMKNAVKVWLLWPKPQ